MTLLEAIVTDADRRHQEGDALVREVVGREGAAAVIATVARLVRERAPRYGEALLFLIDGLDVPDLASAVARDAPLAAALESMLTGTNVRERATAIWALRRLPIDTRDAMLARAAETFLAEQDVISLASLLSVVELGDIIDHLATSDDWLLRWALLPWTNHAVESPLASDLRRRLAFDDDPLVSAEAHQHLMLLDEWQTAAANAQGVMFAVLSNHGPATSFEAVASSFIESWPPEKTTYTLDELRSFAKPA